MSLSEKIEKELQEKRNLDFFIGIPKKDTYVSLPVVTRNGFKKFQDFYVVDVTEYDEKTKFEKNSFGSVVIRKAQGKKSFATEMMISGSNGRIKPLQIDEED